MKCIINDNIKKKIYIYSIPYFYVGIQINNIVGNYNNYFRMPTQFMCVCACVINTGSVAIKV